MEKSLISPVGEKGNINEHCQAEFLLFLLRARRMARSTLPRMLGILLRWRVVANGWDWTGKLLRCVGSIECGLLRFGDVAVCGCGVGSGRMIAMNAQHKPEYPRDDRWKVSACRSRISRCDDPGLCLKGEVVTPHGYVVVYSESRYTFLHFIWGGYEHTRTIDRFLNERQLARAAGKFAREIVRREAK